MEDFPFTNIQLLKALVNAGLIGVIVGEVLIIGAIAWRSWFR